ncbi:MAG TPA: glycosyltransferase [Stellaceae bacterium]|nr:glycosyltransferase [Stellaceae bacterium]
MGHQAAMTPLPNAPRPPRRGVLILGMHRSGTSALTRVVNLLGARLPAHLLAPGPDNPQGFWEGERFMRLHDEMLAAAGLRWHDPWNLPPGFFDSAAAQDFVARLRDLIAAEFGGASLFAIKDPRLCRLVPLWRRALEGLDTAAVIALRDPFEVANSLHRREQVPHETALLLWLRHLIEAEHATRDLPRAVVTYEALLADWREVADQIGDRLSVVWPDRSAESEAAIDAFLDAAARHHAAPKSAIPAGLTIKSEWVGPVYEALKRDPVDRDSLDRIGREIERADALFGEGARLGASWSLPDIRQLGAGLLRARAEIGRLRRRSLLLGAGTARAEAELRDLARREADRHASLVNSTSWRITAPLRRLSGFLSRRRQTGEADADPAELKRRDEMGRIAGSGLWQPEYYLEQHPEAAADPLRHFLETGALLNHRPNPWFDTEFYRRGNARLAASGANPVIDYVEHGAWEGPDPHPEFDNAAYLKAHAYLASRYMTPLAHFLVYGAPSWPAVSDDAPPPPLPENRSLAPLDPGDGWMWDRMLRSGALLPKHGTSVGEPGEFFGTQGRAKLLFVSHEFSQTGAPLILLRLVESLARRVDAEFFVFTDRDGPLNDAFRQVAHLLLGDIYLPFAGGIVTLPLLLQKLVPPAPVLAICNTANTAAYGRAFRHAGIKVINLVHEAATGYAEREFADLFTAADAVVFPSRYVLGLARRKVGRLADQARVIGQGLLQPALLDGDRAAAATTIRTELEVPPATRIVLTCGSLDLRKGADLFLATALAVLRRGAEDVVFVWIGDGPRDRPLLGWWLGYDTGEAGFADRIRFLGPRADTQPWFLGADLFLLTSREDPFPCVVHEAMAAALPVIGFAGGSGAPEALGDTGVFVPYLDVAAMAEATISLLADPTRREVLGAAGRTRVREAHDFDLYVRRLVGLAAELGVPLTPGPSPDKGPAAGFLIAGVQKGGTTSLAEYLRQHPDIFMATPKELHYFDDEERFPDGPPDHRDYDLYFPTGGGRLCGEATPIYAYWTPAMARIRDYNPRIKLVVLLRNPIERAWSHWRMESREGNDPLPFSLAVREEQERCREALPLQHRVYSYIDRGRYAAQIARIRERFPESNLFFVKSEHFFADPRAVTAEVIRFLGLPPHEIDTSVVHYAAADELEMPHEDRAYLREVFRDEIARVEATLGWDCADWLA